MKSVVIGRFQTPTLTSGHLKLLNEARQEGELVVLLGVSRFQNTKSNPMDFETRRLMINHTFPKAIILPIFDMFSDALWSENLDHLLNTLFPHDKIKLFCGRDSFKSHYSGKFEVVEITSLDGVSATEVREEVTASSHFEFRSGIIYALKNQYPRVLPTVDIAIYTDTEILLGRKKDRSKWCLPGGFVDQKDENLEAASSREVKEETGLTIPTSSLAYLTSGKSNDWRCKDDTIMTSFFGVKYRDEFGKAIAGDDLEEVKWFPFEEVDVVNNHKWMINFLLAMLGK